jgi:uncharacterized protein YjbK
MSVSGHSEIELKRRLIGDRAAERLVSAMGKIVSPPREQVNHVFDTDDHGLHRARYALRLRVEPNDCWLTAKGPGRAIGQSGGARLEAETPVEREVAERVLAGELDPIEVLNARLHDRGYGELWSGIEAALRGGRVKSIGRFENDRRTAPVTLPSGRSLMLEIDRTRFPGSRIDEEVELEIPAEDLAPEAEAWLLELLQRAGVSSTESTTKIARFYESLEGKPAP